MCRQLRDARREIDRLLGELADAEAERPGGQRDVTILSSIPGVGRTVLARLLAEAPGPLRARDHQAFRCLCGVAPAFAEDRADFVEVEVSCVGGRAEVIEFVEEMWSGVRVYADPEGRISGAWRVFMTPFVVAVDEEGRVSRKLATPNFDDLVMLLGEMRDGRSGDGPDVVTRAG